MVVEVHLHTILQQTSDGKMIRLVNLALPSGATLAEVLSMLEISLPLDSLLIVLNGHLAEPSSELHEGDILHLIPALSGG